ncbi:hypothetical protein Tco_0404254 [Tanacetum coccineum]
MCLNKDISSLKELIYKKPPAPAPRPAGAPGQTVLIYDRSYVKGPHKPPSLSGVISCHQLKAGEWYCFLGSVAVDSRNVADYSDGYHNALSGRIRIGCVIAELNIYTLTS